MKVTNFHPKAIFAFIRLACAIAFIAIAAVSCTAGDKGDEKTADSVATEPVGNQNPTAVGEAGPSVPADTAAAGNEPKPSGN